MALSGRSIGLIVSASSWLAPGIGLAADPLSAASQAYQAGDVAGARALWMPLARADNAEAAYRVGLLADLGEGQTANTADAYRWYRRAAEAGNAAAAFNVAVMEDSGRGVAHNSTDAALWYGRAAARGNARAQYDLGLLYDAGDGVPQNHAAARLWFHQAAAGGIAAAAAKLDRPEPLEAAPDHPTPDTPLQQVAAAVPHNDAIVTPGRDRSIEIVWLAPAQSAPVRFFLQVVTRDAGGVREIYAAYVDATAALVHLEPTTHAYAWRVFTVSGRPARYTVTPWAAFSLHDLA